MSQTEHPAKGDVKEGDTIIFKRPSMNGYTNHYDGDVLGVAEDGVDVCYLEGYKSRNDRVPWENVLAKLDRSLPWIQLKCGVFNGNFKEYE